MGKLRIEPRVKPPVGAEEYESYKELMRQAEVASADNHVFYDLEKGESPARVKKAFQYVAEKEGIALTIRSIRGQHCLSLKFKGGRLSSASSGRLSAEEARQRILSALSSSKKPLKKAHIISETGISSSSWNLRINELLSDGSVKRHGTGRDTAYSLS